MKRILAMSLACVMLLLVVLMSGCGNNTPSETTGSIGETTNQTQPSSTTGSSESTTEGTLPTETTEDATGGTVVVELTGYEKLPGYEDIDFRGRTFTIAADDGSGDQWRSDYEVYSEDADTVSVAVRRRNDLMKALYKCDIKLIATGAPGSLANADVAGNQHTIDMYTRKYNYYAMNGCYNLKSFNIDFSNPWWDQQFTSAFTMKDSSGNDALFYCVGDFAISAFRAAHAIIYDRTVYENAGITENVYDLVKNKKWTMDKFVEMIKTAAKDTSGNSKIDYADGDMMGWLRTAHATHGTHVASALPIINNVDGRWKLSMSDNAATWTDVVDKAIVVWNTPGAQTLGYSTVHDALRNRKTLFASEVIGTLEVVKDADVSLGLLPYPLYSETQENYAHYVDNHLMYYSVPTSVPDIDNMAAFMELYAYHSRYLVRSAWVEQYCYEFLSDEESADMLNIILDTRTYDPGYLQFNYEADISNMISSGKNNVTKWMDRNIASIIEKNNSFISLVDAANQ